MKELNKISLIVLLLLTIGSSLFARQIKDTPLKYSGKLVEYNKMKGYKNLYVSYNPEDEVNPAETVSLFPKIDSLGNFKFELPNLHKPYKIHIGTNQFEGKRLLSADYYADSEDNIVMVVRNVEGKGIVSFKGQGSEKFELAQALNEQFENDYSRKLSAVTIQSQTVKDSLGLDQVLNDLISLIQEYQAKKSNLLKFSKAPEQIKAVLNFEFARYANEWSWRIWLLYQSNEKYRKQIFDFYRNYNDELYLKPTEWSAWCPLYLKGLGSTKMLEMMMDDNTSSVDISFFYNRIKAEYSGTARDRLIGICFSSNAIKSQFSPYSPSSIDSILTDALKIVKTPGVKKLLIEKKSELAKLTGRKIFEFMFVGTDGKPFDLKQLDGKVILIDTWFTGCFGCAGFHKMFEKEVYPAFKTNKKFVVLSINIDKNEQVWRKGIASILYTSDDYINVNTGNGIGLDHPFMKYYNVTASPYIMLIDSNGNIIYQPSMTSGAEMSLKIKHALESVGSSK